jgi:hypothetical protein
MVARVAAVVTLTCVMALGQAKIPGAAGSSQPTRNTGEPDNGPTKQMAANANAKDELKKAKKQAADDMKGTNLFGQLFLQERMVPLSKPIPS